MISMQIDDASTNRKHNSRWGKKIIMPLGFASCIGKGNDVRTRVIHDEAQYLDEDFTVNRGL